MKDSGGWRQVYGYYWYNDRFFLETARVEDGKPNYEYCRSIAFNHISDIKPLYQKEDDATTQAIGLLKKNGYKIVKEN